MWHVFTYELAIDGNWIADIEGRVEILWSEDFDDGGLGYIEFRHLRNVSEPGIGVREWFASPSLDDPIAKIIAPDIRRLFRMIYGDEVLARAAEARAELAATGADRRNEDMT